MAEIDLKPITPTLMLRKPLHPSRARFSHSPLFLKVNWKKNYYIWWGYFDIRFIDFFFPFLVFFFQITPFILCIALNIIPFYNAFSLFLAVDASWLLNHPLQRSSRAFHLYISLREYDMEVCHTSGVWLESELI